MSEGESVSTATETTVEKKKGSKKAPKENGAAPKEKEVKEVKQTTSEPFQFSKEELEIAARYIAMGSDASRMSILQLIDGERSVNELCEFVGCSQPALSHHLALLKTANMVHPVRDGKQNKYKIKPMGFAVLKAVRDILKSCSESGLISNG